MRIIAPQKLKAVSGWGGSPQTPPVGAYGSLPFPRIDHRTFGAQSG